MSTENRTATKTEFFDLGAADLPFVLRNGRQLQQVRIAYETYGTLNAVKDNALLVFHALTGSQHAAGYNGMPPQGAELFWKGEEVHNGWWDSFIGPRRALDTDKYFVICANYLGGCYGSTGPSSINPQIGRPYGATFPQIASGDIVETQKLLLDSMGIEQLHALVGASVGGMLCLSFATLYPHRVKRVVPIACGTSVTTLQRILNLEQILAIENDQNFNGGDYYNGRYPLQGLAHARMISHKTFVSLDSLHNRAQNKSVSSANPLTFYNSATDIESYMLHQGQKFVPRFDANSYLRIVDMWQRFDLAKEAGVAQISDAFRQCKEQRYFIFSISSDVAFYPEEQDALEAELAAAGVPRMRITVHSNKGHDSFLLEPELFTPHLVYFLDN